MTERVVVMLRTALLRFTSCSNRLNIYTEACTILTLTAILEIRITHRVV